MVGATKVARSRLEQSVGARVESRLQRLARSIFFARSRRAERQTEKTRGKLNVVARVKSLTRLQHPDKVAHTRWVTKMRGYLRENVTGIADGLTRLQDRGSS